MTAVEDPTVTTASHPLEPLTARRDRRRVDPAAQGEKGLGTDARGSSSSRCTSRPRPSCWPGRPTARRCRARRTSSCTSGASARPTRRWSRSPTQSVVVLGAASRASRRRSWPRSSSPARRSCRPTRAGRRRCASAASTDFSLAMVDPWASSWTGPGRRRRRAAHRAAADVGALRAGRERLRAAGRGPGLRGRPRRDGGRRGRRPRRRAAAAAAPATTTEPWLFESGNVPAFERFRERPQADRDHPARGPELHRRRPRRRAGRSGTCGSASRRARAWSCTRSATTGTLPDHPPRLARRDVRALRRPGAHAPVQERVRPGRVRRRLAGQPARRSAATASGDIHYFDGVVNDQDGDAVVIPNADLHARGGRGHRVEAHGLPHRGEVEVRRLRRLVISTDRHRRQLRVRVLLVPLHRRHDRVRGQAHRRHLDRRDRAGRDARSTARWSRPASTARTTSTSSACAWTWRSTATQNTVVEVDSVPSAARAGQPARQRVGDPAAPCWRPRRRRAGDIDPRRGALLEDRERRADVGAGRRRSPTS